ncbi:hypothetical protein QTP88_021005 [Uroleucon formosanum]
MCSGADGEKRGEFVTPADAPVSRFENRVIIVHGTQRLDCALRSPFPSTLINDFDLAICRHANQSRLFIPTQFVRSRDPCSLYTKRYLNVVVIIMTFNLIVDCAPRTAEIIEWADENHFCGSVIPVIMGLICKVPESTPKQVKDTNHGNRVRRNIVDECCKRACTLLYMQSYCHEDLEK